MAKAKKCFTKLNVPYKLDGDFSDAIEIKELVDFKNFIDLVHIKKCLIDPYFEHPNYPLVDFRQLLPSFDAEPYEYHELPGFSLLAFDRELHSFNELFQYDPLFPVDIDQLMLKADGPFCPLENQIINGNTHTLLTRMPKHLHDLFKSLFKHSDITELENYSNLLPILAQMDRAHVFSKSKTKNFQLAGIFASFPSDLDGELKRFGLRIGKFQAGDSKLYLKNRIFILQFLMELYGLPIASERRTSAALFARRLQKMGEKFIIRVMGQSDRTITTIWNDGSSARYPYVEKIALIRVEDEETIEEINEVNGFIDPANHVIIAHICYRQHGYSEKNVRQDRALSVVSQAIIHPDTAESITNINFLHETSSLLLSLNDISRGEFHGRTIYKRTEVVEGTNSEEKRLKTFYAWLLKHQRRIIAYGDESYNKFIKIFENYFETIDFIDKSHHLSSLKSELETRYKYIQQGRTLKELEDITQRKYKGVQLSIDAMLANAVELLHTYKFELSMYFDDLASTAIKLIETMLNDSYINRTYINKDEAKLSAKGLDIRKKYRLLVQLHDEYKAIQKNHKSN